MQDKKDGTMETLIDTNGSPSTPPMTPPLIEMIFNSETFSSGNGDEIAVEPLECSSDGKDENCKQCQ